MRHIYWLSAVVFLVGSLGDSAQDTDCFGTLGDSVIRGDLRIAGN